MSDIHEPAQAAVALDEGLIRFLLAFQIGIASIGVFHGIG